MTGRATYGRSLQVTGDWTKVAAGADDDRRLDLIVGNPPVAVSAASSTAACRRGREPEHVEQEVVELASADGVADDVRVSGLDRSAPMMPVRNAVISCSVKPVGGTLRARGRAAETRQASSIPAQTLSRGKTGTVERRRRSSLRAEARGRRSIRRGRRRQSARRSGCHAAYGSGSRAGAWYHSIAVQ